ncbi:MAG: hypothetical protein AVDCRST_MAG32-2618, partial [uncultured Nocardioides sp.]
DPGAALLGSARVRVGRQRTARLRAVRADHPRAGRDRRRPGLGAVDPVGLRRRCLHLPPAALDHPQRGRRSGGRRTTCRPPRRCPRGHRGAPPRPARLAAPRPSLPPRRRVVPGAGGAAHPGVGSRRSRPGRARRTGTVRSRRVEPRGGERAALRARRGAPARGRARPGGPRGLPGRRVARGVLAPGVADHRLCRGRVPAPRVPRRCCHRAAREPDRAHRRPGPARAARGVAPGGDGDVRRAGALPGAVHGRAGGGPAGHPPGERSCHVRWPRHAPVARPPPGRAHGRGTGGGGCGRCPARPGAAAPGLRRYGRGLSGPGRCARSRMRPGHHQPGAAARGAGPRTRGVGGARLGRGAGGRSRCRRRTGWAVGARHDGRRLPGRRGGGDRCADGRRPAIAGGLRAQPGL